jgi:hypothetical protein
MVRVPVSSAKWSTWKRYCGAVGISMGRAIVVLVNRELAGVVEILAEGSPVWAQRAREELAKREAEIASREQTVASNDQRTPTHPLRFSDAGGCSVSLGVVGDMGGSEPWLCAVG